METQSLLPNERPNGYSYTGDELPSDGQENGIEPTVMVQRKKQWYLNWKVLLSLFILVNLVIVSLVVVSWIPDTDEMQDKFGRITNGKLESFHIDGWLDEDNGGLNTEYGKELQISTSMKVWFDYDLLEDVEERKKFKRLSEGIIKSFCFNVQNISTYDSSTFLGSLRIVEPICLDLKDGYVNTINVTVLVKPKMIKIVGVLKKLWRHEYDNLNIRSHLDINVHKYLIPGMHFKDIRVKWDDFIDWDKIAISVKELHDLLQRSNLGLKTINVKQQTDGFHVRLVPKVTDLVNDISQFLRHRLLFNQAFVIPALKLDVKVPDCLELFSIGLPNAYIRTEEFRFDPRVDLEDSQEPIELQCELEAPLPEQFITQECWSFNGHRITPLTKMLNKLLNSKDKVGAGISADVLDQKHDKNQMMSQLLVAVGYVPVYGHISVNSSTLLQECVLEDISLKWQDGRLKFVGSIHEQVNLSFYEPMLYKNDDSDDRNSTDAITVTGIKGKIKLYHEGVHFLNVPMEEWIPVNSVIERDDCGTPQLVVDVDVGSDNVEVLNKWELSKVFNEMVFQGETQVEYRNALDVQVTTLLGGFDVLGLEWTGETTVT